MKGKREGEKIKSWNLWYYQRTQSAAITTYLLPRQEEGELHIIPSWTRQTRKDREEKKKGKEKERNGESRIRRCVSLSLSLFLSLRGV